ncbi:MAG TPA: SDR family oxidoreductase [Burkholderiaceae bacterium]|nr:SDR family oxidoreductase [Burkholderiaceae bacterium]
MQNLEDKVAVITGAGGGFGREFARLAARAGMRLVLTDVQRDALDAIVDELRESGVAVIEELVDVADGRQVERLAERAYAEFGNVHLLMNNAGVGCGGYLWENSEHDWQWVMGVNLMGVVHGIRHFVPRMLAAEARGEPGHVVNTASMAGWLAPPLMGVYNVSKHGVVALTETLYHDLRLAQSAMGVSLLCPAFVPTGIANSHRNRPAALSDRGDSASKRQAQAGMEKAVSSGRISAAEVAALTFDAVRANRFYVFTHPQIMPGVEARFTAALAGEVPADPFATRPQTRPSAPQ